MKARTLLSRLTLNPFEKVARVPRWNTLASFARAALTNMTSDFVARHLLCFSPESQTDQAIPGFVLNRTNNHSL